MMADNRALSNAGKSSPPVELIRMDRMYESLRYNDYSAQNGLGEIVDNSIEAGAANIAVKFTIEKILKPGKKRPTDTIVEIAVIDDGRGMDFNTIYRCLALGESIHKSNSRGIGRFGVGMTLGSISLARRIEVYSRVRSEEQFLYTFIDLDDIRDGNLVCIPEPTLQPPPEEYIKSLGNSSGTIVILKKCDRVEEDFEGFTNYLGRTYRKFIERGLTIRLNNDPVYLHDPLYIAGPTVFDVQKLEKEGIMEPKATLLGEERIKLDIPDSPGKTANVTIRMSLLPKEWRTERGAGGGNEAKKRKIDQNEGISILRADREVLYAHVPYITGKKGEARSLDIDRWWGCEISFPPELDSYFQVRYIKRGAEPIASLRDQIREVISRTVRTARNIIQEDWAQKKMADEAEADTFEKAEQTMAHAEESLPKSKKGKNLNKRENEHKLEAVASAALGEEKDDPQKKAKKKDEIRKKPYSIELVSYPPSNLFETVHLLDNIVIKLNVNHPFYRDVLQPLCGGQESGNFTTQQLQQDMKNAIALLLFAYAKAESMFEDSEDLFENLRLQWGAALRTALTQYGQEKAQ